jgi:hypothetical protein
LPQQNARPLQFAETAIDVANPQAGERDARSEEVK